MIFQQIQNQKQNIINKKSDFRIRS